MKKTLSFFVVLSFVWACSTVPLTGRKQITQLVPNSQVLPMAYQQYSQVLKKSNLSKDIAQIQQVKRVGRRIQKAVEQYFMNINQPDYLKNYRWDYNVINQDQLNAWCLPGGKVAFYSGILPVCQTDAGVAVVMGHEIAHAIANHGQERLNQQLINQLGGIGLAIAVKKQPERTKQMALTAFGLGSQLGVILPFSRKHESEADRIGLIFMSMAGYNPREAPKFWQRMKNETTKKGGSRKAPEFLSTHPLPDTRIQALNAMMPEALRHYNKAKHFLSR